MKFKRILIINWTFSEIKIRLGFWNPVYWYRLFGYRGIFSWLFSYANFETMYFDYEDKKGCLARPGYQVCIFGFQFGWIRRYDD